MVNEESLQYIEHYFDYAYFYISILAFVHYFLLFAYGYLLRTGCESIKKRYHALKKDTRVSFK